VRGDARITVSGSEHRQVTESAHLVVDGDVVERVGGNLTALVGSHDAPGSRSVRVEGNTTVSSSASHELASDEELVLRCGPSFVRVTEQRIELSAPEVVLRATDASLRMSEGEARVIGDSMVQAVADQVLLRSSAAGLALSSEASIEGSQVLLNSPAQAQDAVQDEPRQLTHIELVDQDGAPLAYQRFRIVLEDGSSIAGVLDADGKAAMELQQGGRIEFPEVTGVQPA